jgi:hypothetical protein
MALPTAQSTSYYVGSTPYLIQLQGADADGTPLVFAISTDPTHGTITGFDPATGALTYTPMAGYLGADSFQFTVTSGGNTTAPATVGLTITTGFTTVTGTLLDPADNPMQGYVSFILTQPAQGRAGLVVPKPVVSAYLDAGGNFTIKVPASTGLDPVAYYQLWFTDLKGKSYCWGVYEVPPSATVINLAACTKVTDANLAARYTFASAATIQALEGSLRTSLGVTFGVTGRGVNRLQRWSGATVTDSAAKQVGTNIQCDGLLLDSETRELTDNPGQFAEVWVDRNGNGAFGIGLDGKLFGLDSQSASVNAGIAFDGSGNAYFAKVINGKLQICRSVSGVVTQLTTIGENFAPMVSGGYCYYSRRDYRGVITYRRIDTSTLADTAYLGSWLNIADYHQIGVGGQSNGLGYGASPPLTITQPYNNKMFNAGTNPGGSGLTSFVPLVEATVETISSAMANALIAANNEGQSILVAGHALSGTAYTGVKKGTTPYSNGQAQVTAGRSIALAASKTHRVTAFAVVHGETDHQNGNASYQANLVEWQSDYETDSKAITGQSGIIPMYISQLANYTKYGQATSLIPIAQYLAAKANPTKIKIPCPMYFLPTQSDGIHYTPQSQQKLGQYFGKAIGVDQVGGAWKPLWPISVTRSGAVVTVQFYVPAGQLVFDTTNVTNPGNYGFEYTDAGSPPAISSVQITAFDTVQITLASTPGGTNKKLRYAYTGTANANGGPTTGARGCLRDTDTLPNWCVVFEEAVS